MAQRVAGNSHYLRLYILRLLLVFCARLCRGPWGED